jgi:hypothetical protein
MSFERFWKWFTRYRPYEPLVDDEIGRRWRDAREALGWRHAPMGWLSVSNRGLDRAIRELELWERERRAVFAAPLKEE